MAPKPRPVADRLWEKIEVGSHWECWPFTGHCNAKGYGKLSVTRSRPDYAHVLVWMYTYGPVPPGLCVLHHCDNPPCCNPEHLFLGTKGDNNRDMAAKGRHWQTQKTHCPQGHPYSGSNLYITPSTGARICRACRSGEDNQ